MFYVVAAAAFTYFVFKKKSANATGATADNSSGVVVANNSKLDAINSNFISNINSLFGLDIPADTKASHYYPLAVGTIVN